MKEKIIQMIEENLTKPRQLTEQVLNYILSHYSYTLDQIDKFFSDVRNLEDYEIDILFSPMFTPGISDKAMFSKILDDVDVKSEDIDEIINQLEGKKLVANFYVSFKNGDEVVRKEFTMPLNSVNLRRYVKLLNLDCQPSKQLSRAIEIVFPNESDKVKAILRDRFWKEDWREGFLRAYLSYVAGHGGASVEKFEFLLKVLLGNPTASDVYEIYELIYDVIQWTQTQVDVFKGGGRRFFNEMIEQTYKLEGADKRVQKEEELKHREVELRYYFELRDEIGYIIENMKELLPINNARRMSRI